MPIISAILGVLSSLPKILDWIEKLIGLIQEEIERIKEKKLEQDLDQGLDKAKKEKNTDELEAIFDPSKRGKSK